MNVIKPVVPENEPAKENVTTVKRGQKNRAEKKTEVTPLRISVLNTGVFYARNVFFF